ncbi:MAG: hypothetical protein ABIC95_07330 [archaeon]
MAKKKERASRGGGAAEVRERPTGPAFEQGGLEKVVNKVVDCAFIGLAAKYYLTSSAITFTGFFIADMITKKKKGESVGLGGLVKSLFNNAADAALNGPVQEEMYDRVDVLENKTFLQKLVKTAIFTTSVATGYQFYYQAQQYIRKEIGYCRAVAAVFSKHLRKTYFQDFYERRIKGQYWSKVRKVMKWVSLFHFASINYVDEVAEKIGVDGMPIKMGIAANNDVIFASVSNPDAAPAKKYGMPSELEGQRYPDNYGRRDNQSYRQAA